MVERSQVIVESLTGDKNVDLGVRPDPRTLLTGLIMPYGRAQNRDVLKEPQVGAFEQIQNENCFSTPRLSAYRRRIGRLRQEVNKPLRRTGHLQYWVAHPWRQKDRCSKRRPPLPSSWSGSYLLEAIVYWSCATTFKWVLPPAVTLYGWLWFWKHHVRPRRAWNKRWL